MLDLKKIQAKFDALFEEETVESFNQWLLDKKLAELMAAFGEGEVVTLTGLDEFVLPEGLVTPQRAIVTCGSVNDNNTQFAMAA